MTISRQEIKRHQKDWGNFMRFTLWCCVGVAILVIGMRVFLV